MSGLLLAVAAVAWGFAFGPSVVVWTQDAWQDPNYGHVVPLSLFLVGLGVWRTVRGTRPVDLPWAGLLVVGAVAAAVGILASEAYSLRVGAILCLAAGVVGLAAPRFRAAWTGPVLAHLLLIPWPYVVFFALTARLQRVASAVAAGALGGLGVPLVREGNLLRLPGYQLEVVEACSGIRGILTLTALAATLAVVARCGPRRTLLLLALAIPTAWVANLLRLVVTGIAAQLLGPERADTVFHLAGGIGTFALGVVVLSAVAFPGRDRGTS